MHSLDLLGLAYQQRARETGDPTYYTKSEQALNRALRLAPRDLLATSGLGSLALSRHRFARRSCSAAGRMPSRRRRRSTTASSATRSSSSAATPQPSTAFDTMATLRPSLSSYARVSHGLELLGRVPEAIETMKLARRRPPPARASPRPGRASSSASSTGRSAASLPPSARTARRCASSPATHYALDALSRIEAAKGHDRAAIALEQQAVDRIPLPQYVAQLGDLYRVNGQPAQARKQYALIGVIERLLVANGVKTDLETALFDVDHGIRLPAALALARTARAERPSIDGDDVLAWALYRNGRCGEALGHSKQALRLGTHDALKLFHRGMIERCLGHRDASRNTLRRALALNPHFSILWAPVARKALQ